MEILLAVLGLIAGWLVTHYYYKRQAREQINPIPYIKGVHEAVLELNGMAIERQDAELQRGIKKLVIAMLYSRNRGINSITVAMMLLSMISELQQSENGNEIKARLDTLEANIKRARSVLSEAADEYDELLATAKEISGKNLADMFTEEEIDQILVNPLNWNRKISE